MAEKISNCEMIKVSPVRHVAPVNSVMADGPVNGCWSGYSLPTSTILRGNKEL